MSDENTPEPKFNSAVATLMRLDAILKRITQLHISYPPNSIERQGIFIDLVRQFFIDAIPLLEEKNSTKYQKEILGFSMGVKSIIKGKIQKYVQVYSRKKEERLNELLVLMQLDIKKYLMPSGEEDDYDL